MLRIEHFLIDKASLLYERAFCCTRGLSLQESRLCLRVSTRNRVRIAVALLISVNMRSSNIIPAMLRPAKIRLGARTLRYIVISISEFRSPDGQSQLT